MLNLGCTLVVVCSFGLVVCQTTVDQAEDGSSGTITFKTPDLNSDEGHSPWVPDSMKCDACKAVTFQLWDHFNKFNELHKYRKYNLPESDILEITEEVCGNSALFNSDFNKKRKSLKYNLPVWELMTLTDQICSSEIWQNYGLKTVEKIERLSGPGMDTSEVPGVTAGGGKWPASYGIKEMNGINRLAGDGVDGTDGPGIIAGGGKWPARLRDLCEQFMGRVGEEKIYAIYKKQPKSRKRLEDFLCRGPANTVRGECLKGEEKVYRGNMAPMDEPPTGGIPLTPPRPRDDDDEDDDDEDWDKDEL